jgi:uracil-DNA glycosylase
MKPTGATDPIVYIIGEGPGAEEDRKGVQFIGRSGQLLRSKIPDDWLPEIRWNNVVRTRPPDNRDPTQIEIECCRPSIVSDIEQSEPKAIFGMGGIPLYWAIGESGITKWNGRRVPIKVGNHTCWFFPMMHPAYILHMLNDRNRNLMAKEIEFRFELDLQHAFDAIEHLPKPVVHTRESALENVDFVTGENGGSDVERVCDFIEGLYDEPIVGMDYETNALRPYKEGAKILTVALAGEKSGALAFPLYHRETQWTQDQLDTVDECFQRFFYKAKCRKVAHNLAFEQEWSAYFYGRKVLHAGKWGCSQSQAFIIDGRTEKGCLTLDFLCLQHFGFNLKAISNLDREHLDDAPLEDVLRYNALDSKYHRLLYLDQAKDLRALGLSKVYAHHLTRIPACVLTQLKGIPVDQKVVSQFHDKYTKRSAKIEVELRQLEVVKKFERIKGREFRPSANHDVLFVIRNILKEDIESSDENALEKVKHPFARLQLRWRKVNKLLSTYVLPYKAGSPYLYSDGMVHPVISTTRTRTWRTSSEDPNAQNAPKRGPGKEVRKQVNPGGDRRVVTFDFSGIQARNVAMESKDATLVKAYWNKYDIHTDWMERIIRLAPTWVEGGVKALRDKDLKKDYRNRAKNEFVFPSFFGAQARSVAGYLGIPETKGQALHEQFWDEFPDIKDWHEELKANYYKVGYVTGLSGFRRYAPISPNQMINSPIQADESKIVCDAWYRLSRYDEPRFQPNLMIHDDLTFVWPKREIEKNAEVVIREMISTRYEWAKVVPLAVEMSVGEDWCTLEKVGEFSSDDWNGKIEYQPEPSETDSWSDGVGWSNHKIGIENASKSGRKR